MPQVTAVIKKCIHAKICECKKNDSIKYEPFCEIRMTPEMLGRLIMGENVGVIGYRGSYDLHMLDIENKQNEEKTECSSITDF